MDIVLGVAMEPSTLRLVLIEGANADGVTVEEDNFALVPPRDLAEGPAAARAAGQVVAAIIGTREGAVESRDQLLSTGVTWTDSAGSAVTAALREELAARDVGSVMLVSPLLAAAALAQTVGLALSYEYIAMLFVEPASATLAVVDIADGSIVDLHRQPLRNTGQGASRGAVAGELVHMLAGLDAPGARANGVFIIGCGVDIVAIKPVLEAATSLTVTAPEEPDMALARGAALASANAPLFASSTAALAYALDPGTGEVSPRALTPTYLDVSAHADRGEGVLAYSALDDDADEDLPRRRPSVLTGSVMAGAVAIVAALLVITSDVRPTSVQQAGPREGVVTPAIQVPPAPPPQAQVPPPGPPPDAPVPEAAAPPVVQQPPPAAVNMAPVTPRRAPTRQAPPPAQEAPPLAAPITTPPAAVPAPAPPPVETAPPTPVATFYLRVPFATIPIPIYPPAPPPPPAPAPGEPAP